MLPMPIKVLLCCVVVVAMAALLWGGGQVTTLLLPQRPTTIIPPVSEPSLTANAASSSSTNSDSSSVPPPSGRRLFEVETHVSLPHPSCLAEAHLRPLSQRAAPTAMPLPVVHRGRVNETAAALAQKYHRPEWNCYKHGGHYKPGYVRANGTYLTLHNVIFSNGMFFTGSDSAASGLGHATGSPAIQRLQFSGYFSMVSGNWPQLVTNVFLVRTQVPPELRKIIQRGGSAEGQGTSVRSVDVAYFQPPTDFLSTYHATVEVVAPALHRLGPRVFGSGSGKDGHTLPASPTTVLTSRPVHSRYGFKPNSCHFGPSCITDSQWGMMFADMVGGPSQIIGLGLNHPQFEHIMDVPWRGTPWDTSSMQCNGTVSSSCPMASSVYVIDRLLVGNPTHCEPLWGPDAFFVEAAGDAVKQSKSYVDCQNFLFQFRTFYLRKACERIPEAPMCATTVSDGSGDGRRFAFNAVIPRAAPIAVLFTSRRGDWAREIVNEDSVVASVRAHLRSRYPHRLKNGPDNGGFLDGVKVVKFGGQYATQVRAANEGPTIFIANHGANIIPSVYMRPNAGVITLSFEHPGFYPFSVFPRWLHWRDLVVEQECNRRLWRGKCKWSSGNNNDMRLSDDNLKSLMAAIDDIVAAQDDAPMRLKE